MAQRSEKILRSDTVESRPRGKFCSERCVLAGDGFGLQNDRIRASGCGGWIRLPGQDEKDHCEEKAKKNPPC